MEKRTEIIQLRNKLDNATNLLITITICNIFLCNTMVIVSFFDKEAYLYTRPFILIFAIFMICIVIYTIQVSRKIISLKKEEKWLEETWKLQAYEKKKK